MLLSSSYHSAIWCYQYQPTKSCDIPEPLLYDMPNRGHVVVGFNTIWQEHIIPKPKECWGGFPYNHQHLGWPTNGLVAICPENRGNTRPRLGVLWIFCLQLLVGTWPEAWKHHPFQINHDTLSYAYSTGGQENWLKAFFQIFFHQADFSGSIHFSGIDGRFPLWKGFNVVVKTPRLPMYLDPLPKLNSAGTGDLCPETWVSKYFEAVETRWVWSTCFNKSSTK